MALGGESRRGHGACGLWWNHEGAGSPCAMLPGRAGGGTIAAHALAGARALERMGYLHLHFCGQRGGVSGGSCYGQPGPGERRMEISGESVFVEESHGGGQK